MNREDEPLITIIVPAYNVDLYISRCLASALGQSYRNVEVIVVDDGSTDGTPSLIKSMKANNPRLRAFFNEHKGAAAARNKGIDEARGDYVFFLDADDYLSYDAIEEVSKVMEDYYSDAIRIEFTRDNAGVVTMDQNAYMRLILDDHLKSYFTATLFKRRLFDDGLRFAEGDILEDYELYPKLISKMKRVSMIRRKDLYIYTTNRKGSVTNSTAKMEKGLEPRMIHSEERYAKFHTQYHEECENVLSQFADYACMFYIFNYPGKTKEKEQKLDETRSLVTRHYDELMDSKIISKFRKKELQCIYENSPFILFFKFAHFLKRKVKGSR